MLWQVFSLLEQVHINIPLVEILQSILKYGKYVKDIVASNRRLTKYETVELTEKFNSRLQNRLLQKLKNSGNFTVPVTIRQNVHAR